MRGDLELTDVSKAYGSVRALDRVSLLARSGEVLALLGPSGSGKSTLLNVVAGTVTPSDGTVSIGGQDMAEWPVERRDIGVVFQSYALFPHMSVWDNVAFPLRVRRRRMGVEAVRERVGAMLDLVGLYGLERRQPTELSGGQQQRVALARALVFEPPVLLLDEPLGALDPALKEQLCDDIRRIRDRLGVTIVYVTHDQQEALLVADRIAVLNRGAIEQIGTPRDVYDWPANEFVAQFLGEANVVRGEVVPSALPELLVDTALGRLHATCATCAADRRSPQAVALVIRPEAIAPAGARPLRTPVNRVAAVVTEFRRVGGYFRLTARAGGHSLRATYPAPAVESPFTPGDTIDLCWSASETRMLGTPPPCACGGRAGDPRPEHHL
ncbi:MAG TPA: ABC transporter ATP-binding protein [Longimicrobium sp.]